MADDTPKQVYARTNAGFVPVSDAARAFFDRVKIGGLVELEGRQPRNLNHHRLFWALMAWAAENADGFETAEAIHSHPRSAAVPIIFITASDGVVLLTT